MSGRVRLPSLFRTAAKAALATTAYGLVHSFLASSAAKAAAARWLGERNRAGLYRPFFNAQAVLTFGVLALYLRSLPRQELYRVEGRPATSMRLGQGAAVVWAFLAARAVGIGPITGWVPLMEWLRGEEATPEPEAQGPAPDEGRGMRIAGPFRFSRHPLNFAPLPIFWLQPTMTTRWLGFTVASTAYLMLGSLHEERRLEAAYGRPYRDYLTGGTPFYIPRPHRPGTPARQGR